MSSPALIKSLIIFLLAAGVVLCAIAAADPFLITRFFYFGTYYFVLALFILWVAQIIVVLRRENFSLPSFLRTSGPALLFPLLVALLVIGTVKPYYNVPHGEMLGLGTAKSFLKDRTLRCGENIVPEQPSQRSYLSSISFRPVLFPFLTSLLHRLLGYRSSNAFLLNAIVLCLLFSTIFLLIRKSMGTLLAGATVILIASSPIVSITARSAGYDLLNAFFIGLDLIFLYHFMERPQPHRFGLLWTTLLMTAYIREESFIYLFIIASALGLAGYWRRERTGNPLLLAATFLILSPVVWLRIAKHGAYVGQAVSTSYFGLSYFKLNLHEFIINQFNFGPALPYNTILNWFGFIFGGWFLVDCFIRKTLHLARFQKQFTLIVAACLFFYHLLIFSWSWNHAYTSPASARFFVIFALACALAPAVFLITSRLTSPKITKILLGTAICLFFLYHPFAVQGEFIRRQAWCREADYTRDFLGRFGKQGIFLITKAPHHLADQDIPATNFGTANTNIKFFFSKLQEHVYDSIIVVQRIDLKTRQPIAADKLDPNYLLEPLEERKVSPGNIICRVSRVSQIKLPEDRSQIIERP